MTTNTDIGRLSDAEIEEVAGGAIGGVISTPISSASLSTISSGVGGMLPGQPSGTFSTGGRFGWAAETGSLLHMHYQVNQAAFFGVMRR
jgi:hypothetical protein